MVIVSTNTLPLVLTVFIFLTFISLRSPFPLTITHDSRLDDSDDAAALNGDVMANFVRFRSGSGMTPSSRVAKLDNCGWLLDPLSLVSASPISG